jgi:hypothetical protein
VPLEATLKALHFNLTRVSNNNMMGAILAPLRILLWHIIIVGHLLVDFFNLNNNVAVLHRFSSTFDLMAITTYQSCMKYFLKVASYKCGTVIFSKDWICPYVISSLQKQNNSYNSNISVGLEMCVIRKYALRGLLRTPLLNFYSLCHFSQLYYSIHFSQSGGRCVLMCCVHVMISWML